MYFFEEMYKIFEKLVFIWKSENEYNLSQPIGGWVDLLYLKQGTDVGIDIIITQSIVDFRIDQVGET